MILRVYESEGTRTKAVLGTFEAFAEAFETNMLEEVQAALPMQQHQLELSFRPFEIKTIKLTYA